MAGAHQRGKSSDRVYWPIMLLFRTISALIPIFNIIRVLWNTYFAERAAGCPLTCSSVQVWKGGGGEGGLFRSLAPQPPFTFSHRFT